MYPFGVLRVDIVLFLYTTTVTLCYTVAIEIIFSHNTILAYYPAGPKAPTNLSQQRRRVMQKDDWWVRCSAVSDTPPLLHHPSPKKDAKETGPTAIRTRGLLQV